MVRKLHRRFLASARPAFVALLAAVLASLSIGLAAQSAYKPGSYSATRDGRNGPVSVTVTFGSGSIEKIVVDKETETPGLGGAAIANLVGKIQEGQTLAVDAVTGATISSEALLGAVEDCVKQAGGNVAALKAKAAVKRGADEETSCDVVVVGAGGGGTAAAMAAVDGGAVVVIIEKGEAPGGAAKNFAEGLLAVGSSQQKAAGITETVDDMYRMLMEYTHYRSNGDLTRAVLDLSGSTIDWMAKHGIPTKLIENTQKNHYQNPWTYHKYVDKRASFDAVYADMKSKGARLYLQAAGKELIVDAGGAVVGVVAEKKDGGRLVVRAKKVILATGGYAGSHDELMKHLNITDYSTLAYANNVGDGIRMARSAGAGTFNLDAVTLHTTAIPCKDPKIWQGPASTLLNLPLLWVNREGRRFVDEGIVYDFALEGNASAAQGGLHFVVVDDATMSELATKGSSLTNTMEKTFLVGFNVDTTKSTGVTPPVAGLYEAMDATIKAGCAFKGDSLAALAAAMGVDPDNLEVTVAAYNEAVRKGVDPRFLKKAEYLKYPVKKGPFYAVEASPVVENSDGGVRVNAQLQVLDSRLKVVKNLYAVGGDAGGIYGDSYPTFEGLTLCFAFNSGRIAGTDAAQAVKAGK